VGESFCTPELKFPAINEQLTEVNSLALGRPHNATWNLGNDQDLEGIVLLPACQVATGCTSVDTVCDTIASVGGTRMAKNVQSSKALK
jgi:hypothetical protein